jgi:hypothetical protein
MPLGLAHEGAPGAEGYMYMPFVVRSCSDLFLLEKLTSCSTSSTMRAAGVSQLESFRLKQDTPH